jgi:zinc-binding alcohol dehydrogenase/oxidoreductase
VKFVRDNRIEPVVDSTYPLDEAEAALRRMESGKQFGKIVLRIG